MSVNDTPPAAFLHRDDVDCLTDIERLARTDSTQEVTARKRTADLYHMTEEFNLDSKAEYTALSGTRSQKLKQTTPVPL